MDESISNSRIIIIAGMNRSIAFGQMTKYCKVLRSTLIAFRFAGRPRGKFRIGPVWLNTLTFVFIHHSLLATAKALYIRRPVHSYLRKTTSALNERLDECHLTDSGVELLLLRALASVAEVDELSQHPLDVCLVDATHFPIVPRSGNQLRL